MRRRQDWLDDIALSRVETVETGRYTSTRSAIQSAVKRCRNCIRR